MPLDEGRFFEVSISNRNRMGLLVENIIEGSPSVFEIRMHVGGES